jgi:hypothetical protein
MEITRLVVSAGGCLALSSLILLTCSAAASICARGAQTMPGQRKWHSIATSAVALDYLGKYCVVGSGADLAGLSTYAIVACRSGATWCFNFSDQDTRSRKAVQRGVGAGAFALCVGVAVASQMAATGSFDPYTLLALAGCGFGCVADSVNALTWRRRTHLVMSAFMLAFGIYTGSWALIAKACIDLGACIYFDPLFGEDRRERMNDALKSMLVPWLSKLAAVRHRRRQLATQNLRGNVNSAREHQLDRIEHDLPFRGLRDESQSAELERAPDLVLLIGGRQHHDRDARIAFA